MQETVRSSFTYFRLTKVFGLDYLSLVPSVVGQQFRIAKLLVKSFLLTFLLSDWDKKGRPAHNSRLPNYLGATDHL